MGAWRLRRDHPQGGYIIHGRSDATLNLAVFASARRIYRQVERVESVLESLAIGQRWDDDVRVVLFVVLKDGEQLDDALQQRIRTEIRTHTTPRHVPARIVRSPNCLAPEAESWSSSL